MNIIQNINSLINNIKIYKTYFIIPYTKITYLILLLLKNYCIKYIYILNNWILIYIYYKKKNLKFKFFNLKNKKNNITYMQLQKLKIKDAIIFTSKGIFSRYQALKLKQGGILFCLIYYSN
uniref:Ribosomal protein S8 n=1 Tax=Cyclospora cayetanensis TaxID=88456 RepID=A0A193BMT7_9EIME|nr:ribosomal protein S8 [Cyclospora cayetanensis]